MRKETIFFSHSSKDGKAINYLKDLIQEKTGNMLNIFLSSDGQSIPFGTNWVHKIEQGLDDSIIMFVFITPNSIKSSWIYFESGFAYSKKIRVIPIGLGITISDLSPPLNLLQGFNITSEDGINNIIKVINDECKTIFKEDVSDIEFNTLMSLTGFCTSENMLSEIVDFIETRIFSYKSYETQETIEPFIDETIEFIRNYFISKNCKFANLKNQINFNGLRVRKVKSKIYSDSEEILLEISADSLAIHFDMLKKAIVQAYGDIKEEHYLKLNLSQQYNLLTDELRLSAIINKIKEIDFLDNIDSLGFRFEDLNFFIRDTEYNFRKRDIEKVKPYLNVIFDKNSTSRSIIDLLNILLGAEIIYA